MQAIEKQVGREKEILQEITQPKAIEVTAEDLLEIEEGFLVTFL